ncbi:hypothetical protein [Zavarzinia aquatilis]|uniref:Uncharacterized protein n=1 Tax=Zavarzinia aquatilis TaxID=2211142 RepID=A0A317EE10_9PROT|nr:hypothetical protein [Zavarzinia aquatilis]PWR24991.1 hypothetical protein DKG74_04270 [Zavarzinia aquatilis]
MLNRIFSDATARWTSQVWWCGIAGGTANALELSRGGLPDLTDGMTLRFRAAWTNTGAVTISWGGRTAVPVMTPAGASLPAGTIRANAIYTVTCYSGVLVMPDSSMPEEGAWTPSPSFSTPGDLAVTSNTLSGKYERVGNRVEATLDGNFTPTWTTAAGNFIINGLPFLSGAVIGGGHIQLLNARFTGYTGTPVARVSPNQAYIMLQTNIAAASTATMTIANLSSGLPHTINLAVKYWI